MNINKIKELIKENLLDILAMLFIVIALIMIFINMSIAVMMTVCFWILIAVSVKLKGEENV